MSDNYDEYEEVKKGIFRFQDGTLMRPGEIVFWFLMGGVVCGLGWAFAVICAIVFGDLYTGFWMPVVECGEVIGAR